MTKPGKLLSMRGELQAISNGSKLCIFTIIAQLSYKVKLGSVTSIAERSGYVEWFLDGRCSYPAGLLYPFLLPRYQ